MCSDLTGWAAALYSALLQPILPLRAPMKFADSHLIHHTSSTLLMSYRFSESRSYLACHHSRLLRNLFDVHPVLNVNLLLHVMPFRPASRSRSPSGTDGHGPAPPRSFAPSCWPMRRSRHSLVAASSSARSTRQAPLRSRLRYALRGSAGCADTCRPSDMTPGVNRDWF